jgi:hypothetical protein
MNLVGTARSADIHEPSAIDSFFQTTQVHFLVVTDQEVKLPSGPTSIVPVRIDLFERTPNLEGARVEIEGEFDAHLALVRANTLAAPEWRFRIGAVRRMNPLLAAFLLVVTVLVQWIAARFILSLIFNGIIIENGSLVISDGPLVVSGAAGLVLLIMAVWCAALFYRYAAFPSLTEWFSRVMHRIVAYPNPKDGEVRGAKTLRKPA